MKHTARVIIVIVGLLIVLGGLGTVKGLQIRRMVNHDKTLVPPPQTVSAAQVNKASWETSISAVGSLEAESGVVVTAEIAGKITQLHFQSGAVVKAGQLLLKQDASTETAQLNVIKSEADLALKDLERARKLYLQKVIPQSRLDEINAGYQQAVAQMDLIRTTIAKKSIKAPFTGRLGLRQVSVGEFLESGQPVVSLQSLDPINVNFQVPQQYLAKLATGLAVQVRSDAVNGQVIEGMITAINSEVESRSRNIAVQASLTNKDERLRPGMYASVNVILPERESVLAIPATAVNYAPYSDSVFLVESAENSAETPRLLLRQQFVTLGEKRGDFVAVSKGLTAGQTVVSSGVFKLRNGQAVVVDNRLAPIVETNPKPEDA